MVLARLLASVAVLDEILKCVPSCVPSAPPVVVLPAHAKPLIPLARLMPVAEGFMATTVTVAVLEVPVVVVLLLLLIAVVRFPASVDRLFEIGKWIGVTLTPVCVPS